MQPGFRRRPTGTTMQARTLTFGLGRHAGALLALKHAQRLQPRLTRGGGATCRAVGEWRQARRRPYDLGATSERRSTPFLRAQPPLEHTTLTSSLQHCWQKRSSLPSAPSTHGALACSSAGGGTGWTAAGGSRNNSSMVQRLLVLTSLRCGGVHRSARKRRRHQSAHRTRARACGSSPFPRAAPCIRAPIRRGCGKEAEVEARPCAASRNGSDRRRRRLYCPPAAR